MVRCHRSKIANTDKLPISGGFFCCAEARTGSRAHYLLPGRAFAIWIESFQKEVKHS